MVGWPKKHSRPTPDSPGYVAGGNARYDKNRALTAWRASKRLGPAFLPPCSPIANYFVTSMEQVAGCPGAERFFGGPGWDSAG